MRLEDRQTLEWSALSLFNGSSQMLIQIGWVDVDHYSFPCEIHSIQKAPLVVWLIVFIYEMKEKKNRNNGKLQNRMPKTLCVCYYIWLLWILYPSIASSSPHSLTLPPSLPLAVQLHLFDRSFAFVIFFSFRSQMLIRYEIDIINVKMIWLKWWDQNLKRESWCFFFLSSMFKQDQNYDRLNHSSHNHVYWLFRRITILCKYILSNRSADIHSQILIWFSMRNAQK